MSVLRSKVHGRSHSDKFLQARGCWGGFLFTSMNYRNHEIVWIKELFFFFIGIAWHNHFSATFATNSQDAFLSLKSGTASCHERTPQIRMWRAVPEFELK